MQSEKLTCANKLQEVLTGVLMEGINITIHTTKETACSTPQIEAVEFRSGDKFVVLKAQYGLTVLVPPTPKMVKKIRITGQLAGREVSQVFDLMDYVADFTSALTDVKTEAFEEPEA